MKYDEFIERVQSRAELESSDQAVLAARATLITLAERLSGEEPAHLASELPRELGRFISDRPPFFIRSGESFSADEFYDRVSIREGEETETAVRHACAVMAVLKDAVSPGELEDIKAQLPEDYDSLFGIGAGR
jgi:uncharacterized protein (DUF2267 family)